MRIRSQPGSGYPGLCMQEWTQRQNRKPLLKPNSSSCLWFPRVTSKKIPSQFVAIGGFSVFSFGLALRYLDAWKPETGMVRVPLWQNLSFAVTFPCAVFDDHKAPGRRAFILPASLAAGAAHS